MNDSIIQLGGGIQICTVNYTPIFVHVLSRVNNKEGKRVLNTFMGLEKSAEIKITTTHVSVKKSKKGKTTFRHSLPKTRKTSSLHWPLKRSPTCCLVIQMWNFFFNKWLKVSDNSPTPTSATISIGPTSNSKRVTFLRLHNGRSLSLIIYFSTIYPYSNNEYCNMMV